MRTLGALVLALYLAAGVFGQEPDPPSSPANRDLYISQEDLWIEQGADGGFHLFIRKKSAIASVLLTETTRDPALKEPNYAYRTPDWNPVNGDEIRLINEVPITRTSRIWSLIDSTPEIHPTLGEVFHLYIPYILYYGYENTRHGEIYVQDGTYFNIRSFSLPYGDYRGFFQDNPFILEVTQDALEGPADRNYMRDTINRFAEITTTTHGDLWWSREPADLVDKIRGVLEKERRKSLDVVFCLDTTRSMQADITAIKRGLPALLKELAGEFIAFRAGMVLYQDYTHSAYLTRIIPFTDNLETFQKTLQGITLGNGGDIPEAVYEALYEGIQQFPWEAESKFLILIGDAPPHPRPKGKINKDMVLQGAIEKNIKIHAIILPQ
ncbi:MAG: VWA domain-containing protein [Spirochaetaceae bacterium]|jgi:Mg-chelatase subunit ChlD|nr:VWA domain-containing protein [Spirochaetaceae bacterium]